MNTYTITITEVSKCKVEVEAETKEEAVAMVEKKYWDNPIDYVLEPEETTIN